MLIMMMVVVVVAVGLTIKLEQQPFFPHEELYVKHFLAQANVSRSIQKNCRG